MFMFNQSHMMVHLPWGHSVCYYLATSTERQKLQLSLLAPVSHYISFSSCISAHFIFSGSSSHLLPPLLLEPFSSPPYLIFFFSPFFLLPVPPSPGPPLPHHLLRSSLLLLSILYPVLSPLKVLPQRTHTHKRIHHLLENRSTNLHLHIQRNSYLIPFL